MDTKIKSNQEKETKNTDGSGARADRFGRIAPAAHAENCARARKPQAGGKAPVRTRTSGRENGRRARLQMVVLFVVGLPLLYVAAMYLVVPAVIRGPLAREVGRSLGCRLSLKKIALSPFTFRFRGESISLKSPNAVGDEKPFLQVAVISGRIQPLPLLQGRVRIGELRIERPKVFFTRDGSGRYNLPFALEQFKKELRNSRLRLDPDFLSFQVIDGTFIFDDQLTGNRHRVEHLLYNPDAEGGPQLQATVNGSPVTLSRGSGNLLQLQLNNIELGRYLAYLPVEKELPLSLSGRADGTLELSLPSGKTGSRFEIQGVLALRNVHVAAKKDTVQADIAAARFSFELALPEGRLRIRELVLRQPSFVFTGGSFPVFPAQSAPWLKKTSVQRLLIDQGRIALQVGGQTFHVQDLQASVKKTSGGRTGNDSSPATFQLSGHQTGGMHGELSVEGTIVRGNLNGHLRVRGVDLAYLPKTVRDGLALVELKGAAELDAEILIQLAGKADSQHLYLRNSRLQLHDFQFLTGRGVELSGKGLLCQGAEFVFDTTSGRPLCDRLDLEQAKLTLPTAGIVQLAQEAVEHGSPLFGDLELLDSTIHFVDDDKQDLVKLQRVLVRLHGLSGQVDNPGKISLQAAVGEQGVIRLSGDSTRGKAQLEYAFKDVELTDVPLFRSWSSLQVKGGQVRARGRLVFPEAEVTGKFVVDDFLATDPAKGSLQWRQLTAQGVTLQLQSPAFSIDEIALNGPVLRLQQGTDGFFPPFAHDLAPDAWWRDRVVLKKIAVMRGEFQSGMEAVLPGLYPTATDLAGTVEGWPADPFLFTLDGKLEGGALQIKGRAEDAAVDYALQVDDFPLGPLAADFLQTYGLVVDNAMLSWQRTDSPNGDDRQPLRCVLRNLRPLPGSPLERTLALLTDTKEEIVLNVDPAEEDEDASFLVPRVVDTLHAIRLRELAQPGATLRDRLPFLELPDTIKFQIGLDSSDGLFFLDDYAELLQSRPHLRLVVEGGMDLNADGAVLQEVLQEEADARLEVENLRRQQKRDQWIFQQKLEAAAGSSRKPSVEPTRNEQIPEELRPLPWQLVEVPPELLDNLAGKRAEQVRQYLVTRQGIAPERIVVRTSTRVGSAAAFLSLEPFYPALQEDTSDE